MVGIVNGRGVMRKKSHISLAMYLVREMKLEGLYKHRKAFYFGSILPDLTPKMVTSPHEFATSYADIQEFIRSIFAEGIGEEWKERVFWRRIGFVLHYMADYFTFPHNVSFEGNLKDHCMYESEMKYYLREFVWTAEARQIFARGREEARRIRNIEELFGYIEKMHEAYMQSEHSVAEDCRQILLLCSAALGVLAQAADTERMVRVVPRYGWV